MQNKAFAAGQSISRAIVRVWWLWPLLAAFVTFFLIMTLAYGQSIWFDEGYSIQLAKRPVGELLALTGVDAHPPLYYLLLKAWAGVFGWGEYALRSLSAVMAAITVGVVFLTIRKLFTVRTALVVLPFLVLAPFALRYGYEIRMYALAALIGALATLVLAYAYKSKDIGLWVVYAALVALGMYTLYMMAAIWLAHVVWLLVVTRRRGFAFFKQPWIGAFVLAVVFFAAYLPTLFYQLEHSALPGIGNAVTLTQLAQVIGLAVTFTPEWKLSGLVSIGLLAIVGVTIYLLVTARRAMPRSQRASLWLIVSLVLVPLAFFALTSLSKSIFVTRYMAHVIMFSYALIGLAVALGWRYGQRVLSASLAVLAIGMLMAGVVNLSIVGNFVFERLQRPETREVRRSIDCSNDTVIVADDPYTYIDGSYYFNGCDMRFYSKDDVKKEGGYAPLHGSNARLSDASLLSQPVLYHLYFDSPKTSFTPDSRYRLVQSTIYDKQVVDRYELLR